MLDAVIRLCVLDIVQNEDELEEACGPSSLILLVAPSVVSIHPFVGYFFIYLSELCLFSCEF